MCVHLHNIVTVADTKKTKARQAYWLLTEFVQRTGFHLQNLPGQLGFFLLLLMTFQLTMANFLFDINAIFLQLCNIQTLTRHS